MSEARWRSVHVAYHDERCDDLVVDAVAPLFSRTSRHAAGQYFTRHWRRGPHLRLNFQAAESAHTTVIRPAVEEVVGGYLAARPSRARLDPAAYAAQHARLAQLEREPGPLQPWYRNNSIQAAEYDDRIAALGSQAAAALLTSYYVRTTPLAFRMTDRVRSGGPRLELALDLMLATAHSFCRGGIARGFVSFRSHAEAFLASSPRGAPLRAAWNRAYEGRAEGLAGRVRAVVADLDRGTGSVPFIREWASELEPIRHTAQQLLREGLMSMDPVPPDDAGQPPGDAGQPPLAELSPFHRAIEANDRWHTEVWSTEWFGTYRLSLNYAYLHLTRLGVKPIERLLLCHLAANAVEDCTACRPCHG
jgi:Lantibiotic biosynthesis dehydratase C-term